MSDLFSENTASRHRELVAAIRHHNELYYLRAAPEISDYDYDALLRELSALEKEHPELRSPDSPTQTVGAASIAAETAGGETPDATPTQKVKHRERMLSLHNSYDAADLKKFCDRVGAGLQSKNLASGGFMTELKIDGLAVALIYEHGRLTLGATRGDGREGEDITDNLRQVSGVPLKLTPTKNLPALPARLEVRGEVYLPRENFSRLCAEQEANGDTVFANPRNAAAGTLKVKNPAIIRERGLAAFFYATPDAAAMSAASQAEILTVLGELGLPTNPHAKLCATYEEIIARRDELDSLRRHLPYDTDGMVVKVNAVAAQRELGNDAKAPVWAVAYKFLPEQAETTLANIRWQVGKFGTLTPVADLTPVWLSGSTIASATLHNFDYIRAKDLRIGDRVVIEKAGEIIPQVIKNLPEKRRGDEAVFAMPTTCPACGAAVAKDADKVASYCPNSACPAQLRERLIHFVARANMDLRGFGEKNIERLLTRKLVADVADLFYLDEQKLAVALAMVVGRERAQAIVNAVPALSAYPTAPLSSAAEMERIFKREKLLAGDAKVNETRGALAAAFYAAPEKLLTATADDIADLPFAADSVKNLSQALAEGKKRPLAQLLAALAIPNLGATNARIVARHFSTMENLMTATLPESAEATVATVAAIATGETFSYRAETGKLSEVKRTLGAVAARSLVTFFADEHNRKIVERLRAAGVNMTQPAEITATGGSGLGAAGKIFVLTGSLPNYQRADAKKMLEAAGGRVASAVSRATDYVVAGADAGSKLDQARQYGVAVIDEAAMLKLCGL